MEPVHAVPAVDPQERPGHGVEQPCVHGARGDRFRRPVQRRRQGQVQQQPDALRRPPRGGLIQAAYPQGVRDDRGQPQLLVPGPGRRPDHRALREGAQGGQEGPEAECRHLGGVVDACDDGLGAVGALDDQVHDGGLVAGRAGRVRDRRHQALGTGTVGILDRGAQGVVDGPQLLVAERLLQRRHAPATQPVGQAPPDVGAVAQLPQLPEHARVVGVQRDMDAALADLPEGAEVFQAGPLLAIGDPAIVGGSFGQPQPLGQGAAHQPLRPVALLDRVGGRIPDPPGCLAVPVVVHDQGPRGARPVRVGEHVLVDAPGVVPEVVQQEVRGLGEVPATVEQGHDLALVAGDQPLVDVLVHRRPAELHAVLLGEALELPVPEHRQAGEGREERGHADVLVALAELLDRGLLVRVVHEVDVALEDLRVELQGLLEHAPVACVVLVAEHVHERAVVDAVHAQGPDEVALQHPEGLGEEQRVRDLSRDPVHDLAPELLGHGRVEGGLGHRAEFGARRDPAAALAGAREPEPADVPLRQHHRRVEADDGEAPGDCEDRLDHLFPDRRLAEIQLGGVVPGEARAVVAVVDIAPLARPPVAPLEADRGVGVVPVVILEADLHAVVLGEVLAAERVRGIGRLRRREEPLRVLDDPAGVETHVVGDHVGREADAAGPGAVAQVRPRILATEVVCDHVVVQRVRRCRRVRVAAPDLDPLRCLRALPQTDQPEARDAPAGEPVQLRVRDRVKGADLVAVSP